MTYVNSLFFAPLLLPYLVRYLLNSGGSWSVPFRKRKEPFKYAPVADDERNETQGSEDCNGSTVENGHIVDESDGNNLKDTRSTGNVDKVPAEAKINVRKTASLSFEFSILWVRTECGLPDCNGS